MKEKQEALKRLEAEQAAKRRMEQIRAADEAKKKEIADKKNAEV